VSFECLLLLWLTIPSSRESFGSPFWIILRVVNSHHIGRVLKGKFRTMLWVDQLSVTGLVLNDAEVTAAAQYPAFWPPSFPRTIIFAVGSNAVYRPTVVQCDRRIPDDAVR
jgi:hypothetical protein